MNNNKITESLTSELIHELTANMLIVRDGLIQSRNQIDREIKRIEEYIGKDTIKKITEGYCNE